MLPYQSPPVHRGGGRIALHGASVGPSSCSCELASDGACVVQRNKCDKGFKPRCSSDGASGCLCDCRQS